MSAEVKKKILREGVKIPFFVQRDENSRMETRDCSRAPRRKRGGGENKSRGTARRRREIPVLKRCRRVENLPSDGEEEEEREEEAEEEEEEKGKEEEAEEGAGGDAWSACEVAQLGKRGLDGSSTFSRGLDEEARGSEEDAGGESISFFSRKEEQAEEEERDDCVGEETWLA